MDRSVRGLVPIATSASLLRIDESLERSQCWVGLNDAGCSCLQMAKLQSVAEMGKASIEFKHLTPTTLSFTPSVQGSFTAMRLVH